MSDAQTLLDLTATDHALLRLKKQLDDLPQRAKLLELRAKRAEVEAKAKQVAQMNTECSHTIKQLQDEETMLKDKTASVQAQIDATSNYKQATALAHEIEGFARRAEKIEFDMLKQFERSDKIAQVEEQVSATLARLTQQDEELFASYQEQAGALRKEAAASHELREKLAAKLPPDLLKRYEKARESKGGFGAAHIEGNHCSGCRVEFTEGQLAKLRDVKIGEEIGACPYCHRLLVVK
jgi:predicted  nucleic acid-binding Zn-ribbon protein